MANRSLDRDPKGADPQLLVDKIVRSKVYESRFWKEHCFALTAATLVDRAAGLRAVGGTYGGTRRPSEFVCLVVKMLQLAPAKEIVLELLAQEELKYVRLLAAVYLRLVGRATEVYARLEPLLADYRKVCVRQHDGTVVLRHVDEVVDLLLTERQVFDLALPLLPPRRVLEAGGLLRPRRSRLVDMGAVVEDT